MLNRRKKIPYRRFLPQRNENQLPRSAAIRLRHKRGRARVQDRRRRKAGPLSGKVRYAVVGLGHIAQTAVLPAFGHATKNSELVALVSQDRQKLKALQRRYQVPRTAAYHEYDSLLRSGEIDAVFISEPNSLHREFAVRAAEAGIHVLCEKPLAVTQKECREMIQSTRRNHVKLMTAYRLHFERSNLEAVEVARSGRIGEPRFFNSIFSLQTKAGNIRLRKKMGGGTLYDLGVYCINAARYLFRAEPTEVVALTAKNGEKRFREVEEMTGALLRFPGERLASFICSFGAADTANYDIVGTKGALHLKGAYEYAMPVQWELSIDGKEQKREFAKRDQFAPELVYFSDCIRAGMDPEPSGLEGLNDIKIIEALYRSAATGRPVKLKNEKKLKWPGMKQEIRRPPVPKEPVQVHADNPSKS
jgi:predicted dehydrogenase